MILNLSQYKFCLTSLCLLSHSIGSLVNITQYLVVEIECMFVYNCSRFYEIFQLGADTMKRIFKEWSEVT